MLMYDNSQKETELFALKFSRTMFVFQRGYSFSSWEEDHCKQMSTRFFGPVVPHPDCETFYHIVSKYYMYHELLRDILKN